MKKLMNFLKPLKRARGGIHPSQYKNTDTCETIVMPPPSQVIIPMQQHIGAPCLPVVKIGDTVRLGQLIADSDKYVSAPIHASVSGTVSDITDFMLPSGQLTTAIVIDSDGEMTPFEALAPYTISSKEDLINAARMAGLVGLGGAGFPLHVKLAPPQDKKIDTLIINAAECEPYITSDYREMLENTTDVINGIKIVLQYLQIPRCIIVVEDNKPQAIEKLRSALNNTTDILIMPVKTMYPKGAEKVTILLATGRQVPVGKLPSDVGCLVINVTSIASLYRFIHTGMPLVTKRITIDGDAINTPKNILVPIGTSIKEVIEFSGGYKTTPRKIIMGGPMMGVSLVDDSLPILKQNNAILAFSEDKAHIKKETACIRCGKCALVCPMSLTPVDLATIAKSGDYKALRKAGITACIECGSCSYICPAGKPLIQTIRYGKTIEKKEGK